MARLTRTEGTGRTETGTVGHEGYVGRPYMEWVGSGTHLRINEPMIVGVVMMVTRCSSTIFWNVPASWSAWQCVRITYKDTCACMRMSVRWGGAQHR